MRSVSSLKISQLVAVVWGMAQPSPSEQACQIAREQADATSLKYDHSVYGVGMWLARGDSMKFCPQQCSSFQIGTCGQQHSNAAMTTAATKITTSTLDMRHIARLIVSRQPGNGARPAGGQAVRHRPRMVGGAAGDRDRAAGRPVGKAVERAGSSGPPNTGPAARAHGRDGLGREPGRAVGLIPVLIQLRPPKTPLVLIKIIRPMRWIAGSTLAAFGGSPRQ
jgi:hypothetical protein